MASVTTKAVLVEKFGGPEVMQMGEKPLPAVGVTQVLVAIKAAGVNPSDTYIRLGPDGPYAANPHLLPALPYTPGKDGAGVVEEVGAEVVHVKAGDRVYCSGSLTGTLAEHAICEARTVYPLPDAATFQQGACVGVPCATAHYALHVRARVAAGESVFIHGASGAVGLAAIQLAKAAGAGTVVGSAGTEAGQKAVRDAGADEVVNHRSAGYIDEAKKAVPAGFDVVLEMSAHANLPIDLSMVAKRGRVCIIGSKSQEVAVNPRALMTSEVDVRGVFLGCASPEELAATHEGLIAEMSTGKLAPVVGMELPLEEAPMAHKEVMEPSSGGATGNIVLVP